MRNSAIDEETLAMDVIREVGAGLPNLIFLDRDHTTRHYMHEQWKPTVFNRQNYTVWSGNGKPSTHETCNRVVKLILENHKPEPLPQDVLDKLEAIAIAATNPETLAVSKTAKATRRRKFRAA
jgi:trimethylamine--corrinoid protein Co-methyltransferase